MPRVERLKKAPRPPGLAVILCGDDPGSEIYVRNKVKTCDDLGIHSEQLHAAGHLDHRGDPGACRRLNARDDIDGILVQMPLPKQIDPQKALLAVDPDKDVDGFHPLNMGFLLTGRPGPRACTPAGIMELLQRYEIPLKGERAVVDRPQRHRRQADGDAADARARHGDYLPLADPGPAGVAREADLLVAAIGRPAFVTGDFIKAGATVHRRGHQPRVPIAPRSSGYFGDNPKKLEPRSRQAAACWSATSIHGQVAEKAGAYTPVPGGVGPLTIAMLMVNTIESAGTEAQRLLRVGLTGGLATGKSFVGETLAGLGCLWIQSDAWGTGC